MVGKLNLFDFKTIVKHNVSVLFAKLIFPLEALIGLSGIPISYKMPKTA